MVLFDFQFQNSYADACEIEVAVKKFCPTDVTKRFIEKNGINKMRGVKCKTDLERTAQNVFAAVEGALDDFLIYFILFSSYAKYESITL